MKIIKVLILSIILIFISWNLNIVNSSYTLKIISKEESQKNAKLLTIEDTINYFWNFYWKIIPESYKYINVNIRWVNKDSEFYKNLQKLIYSNVIKNKNVLLKKDKNLSSLSFYKIAEKIFWVKLINQLDIEKLKIRKANFWDINNLEKLIKKINNSNNFEFYKDSRNKQLDEKRRIFLDVYKTLLTKHYNKKNLDEGKMLDSAIEWLAIWTWDKFTRFFPPKKSKNFNESLTWEYEWIWAYVDMEVPWQLKIISPIIWSPADKAWLKAWDIIIKVWNNDIKKENSISEVISWIKWPSWTKVELTIKRWTKTFKVEVLRKKITIDEVESKMLDYRTFYIQLKFFWKNASNDFKKNLEKIKGNKKIKKIIIDLRNNPWGYLDQVTDILSYFVKKWEKTAVIKYIDSEMSYKSNWYELIDFNNYKIVILENWGSASASEIMIWTIKDYYPDSEIIWTKSYWKGSVQTIKPYSNWSSLKYTIAKWFTWKTETGIDWIGIEPTIKLEPDEKKLGKLVDVQLEKAKSLR